MAARPPYVFMSYKHEPNTTGLTEQFKTVREKYGPFDVSMLEIGQWHPAWGSIHLGPKGALEAHAMLGATHLVPIHWATFRLAPHPWSEPVERMLRAAAAEGVAVATPRPGQLVSAAVNDAWWRD